MALDKEEVSSMEQCSAVLLRPEHHSSDLEFIKVFINEQQLLLFGTPWRPFLKQKLHLPDLVWTMTDWVWSWGWGWCQGRWCTYFFKPNNIHPPDMTPSLLPQTIHQILPKTTLIIFPFTYIFPPHLHIKLKYGGEN